MFLSLRSFLFFARFLIKHFTKTCGKALDGFVLSNWNPSWEGNIRVILLCVLWDARHDKLLLELVVVGMCSVQRQTMEFFLCAIWLSFATFYWLSAALKINPFNQLLIDLSLNVDTPSSFYRQNGYAGTYPGRSSSASGAPSTLLNRFVSTGGSPNDIRPDR